MRLPFSSHEASILLISILGSNVANKYRERFVNAFQAIGRDFTLKVVFDESLGGFLFKSECFHDIYKNTVF